MVLPSARLRPAGTDLKNFPRRAGSWGTALHQSVERRGFESTPVGEISVTAYGPDALRGDLEGRYRPTVSALAGHDVTEHTTFSARHTTGYVAGGREDRPLVIAPLIRRRASSVLTQRY
jgi:hypothetical protein